MLKRKDRILISAIELLDAEGVSGITTKNIAKLQKITEPALYRQYIGKQDILEHIIEDFAGYDVKITNTIKEAGLTGIVAIEFYVKRYAELYENYSEVTTVMFSMDLYQYNDKTRKRMQEIMNNRIDFLESIITDQEIESFEIFNAKEMASFINGIIFSQVYEWRIKDKSYSLQDRLMDFVLKFLDGRK